ncbi:unnamed protein product [Schistosoma haematobium]|nr:unnamed protein product [Schistosoma haematobium]
MLNNDLILRIQTIYSNQPHSNEFIQSSYLLLNDIIHYYNINYFSLYTISILGRFLSYIIRTIGTIDDINMKCIDTLHYLVTNQLISIKLKTTLIHLLELDLATNLLNKQSNINQYTWNCLCDYIIDCNNIAPIIRILIYICLKTIIMNPIEYKQYLIKLKHFITMTTKYQLDFYEMIMIFKLLNDKSKGFHARITSFCFNIMQLLHYSINDSDYYNAMNYIRSGIDHGDLSQVNFIPDHHSTISNYGNLSDDIYNGDLSQINFIPDHYSTISNYGNQSDDPIHLNDSSITTHGIILIPNYIYSLLYYKNDYMIQLKGIKALQLFTWKMFCHRNSLQYYSNLICYIKNIRIFLTNIFNIMYHQSINVIVHLIDIILMLLHHLPNYVIQSIIKEIFQLFKPILINNLKTMYHVIHRILLQLLTYFKADIILDELWLYYKNNHNTNFRIRTNTLYCMTFLLCNKMEQNIDLMKMIKRIVQCFKDKSGVVQSAAAKCCATLININNNKSILSIIENLLLNEMSIMEVNFLLEKIKKFIKLKNDNDDGDDLVAMVNYENDFKQNYNRGIHHLDYRSDTIDKSIRRNTSERLNMPNNHLDLNKMNHLINGSYFQMSEHRKRLKSSKSDNQKLTRRYIDKMTLHDYSVQTQSQLDHRKHVKDHPNTKEIYDEPITNNVMSDLQNTLTGEEINCPVDWYNQSTEYQINRGLESLRNSVSRRRKQWLFNQMAKMNTKKLSESNHDNLFQMKPLNIENQDFPLCLNSDRWTSQDNGDYLVTSNNEKHLLPTYEYCENLSNQWRTDTPCSLNRHSYKQSKCSVNNKMYRSMNDIHLHVNKEQSKMDYNSSKSQEKQSNSTQQKSKYSSSYKEGIQNDSHIIKKTIDHSKRNNKPIRIEEQILEYITSNNWEEQIKAIDIIENLLETMNVKPLEIIFSDSNNINMLVCGIEQAVKCLRSQVTLKGLKIIEQLCLYLNTIHQGHLLNPYGESLITTLLSRISEDSSTKFLQNQSYQSLETLISCIDHVMTIHVFCTNLWEKCIRSDIKRNTIGQLLTFILYNNKKKTILLFKRLGLYGMNQLMKVVQQLINDKVSSTRLYGRRILEQINLFTDINKVVYKQNTMNDHSLELKYIKSKNLTFRR